MAAAITEQQDFLSKIRVIFNNRLRNFIKKLKRTVDLSDLDGAQLFRVLPVQHNIRQYIVENQQEFDMSHGKRINENDHPNLYALALCVIIPDLAIYSSFQEVLDESQNNRWEIGLHATSADDIGEIANGEQGFKCVCNHPCSPVNLFIIYNKESGMHLCIGCDCAEKTGFIEPDELRKIKSIRIDDPNYKELMGVRDEKNRKSRLSKLKRGLSNLGETIETIKRDYDYVGGTHGEHIDLFNIKYPHVRVEDMRENKCIGCDFAIKKNYFIAKITELETENDEIIALCENCITVVEKMPVSRKGVCEDCGDQHRNRADNLCDGCRKKTVCVNCPNRDICDNKGRCNMCKNLNYCKLCDIIAVQTHGYSCRSCFTQYAKKCGCGKMITNPKYKKCYNCNQSKNK